MKKSGKDYCDNQLLEFFGDLKDVGYHCVMRNLLVIQK